MQMTALNHSSQPPKSPDGLTPPKSTGDDDSKQSSCHCPGSVCLFVVLLIGALCIAFLLTLGLNPFLFLPSNKNHQRNLAPIVHQGNMFVYPPYFDIGKGDGANSSYIFSLPSEDTAETNKYLNDIFDSYPQSWSSKYSDCWIESPSYDKPCFYHREWLGSACSEVDNFGFSESDGRFNPCLGVRLEQTDNWVPVPEPRDELPTSAVQNFAPQFVQLFCAPKRRRDRKNIKKIVLHPRRGFPTQFFPASNFPPNLYLPPAVAIQVVGLKKGQNVTIECGLLAQNALELWDNGLFTLTFVSR